ncbi:hypothetical protein Pmani_016115 [Petrolisthes manimaculis]|uniref:Uncharacterized protein n=1 Tax=Petrolisthes manimaculis TaxID=1843537 RepID=A0AAE1PQB3_9EUCA|nr:hypothetical protein Pmani_016115 [Petrolisthes manimaculis]
MRWLVLCVPFPLTGYTADWDLIDLLSGSDHRPEQRSSQNSKADTTPKQIKNNKADKKTLSTRTMKQTERHEQRRRQDVTGRYSDWGT